MAFGIFLRRLFWILLALGLIWFSVSNRHAVPLSLAPFPWYADLPLYLIFFAGVFFGVALSVVVSGWLRLKGFLRAHKAERRAKALESEVAVLAEDSQRRQAETAHARASEDMDTARDTHSTRKIQADEPSAAQAGGQSL